MLGVNIRSTLNVGKGIDGSLKYVVLNQIPLLFTLYPLLITHLS